MTISSEKKDATRVYKTDSTGLANNEDSYTMNPADGIFQNDRVLGEIILAKSDLDQLRQDTPRSASSSAVPGTAPHGEASIEGAVYDLYAAEDIFHPDGVTGVVDYSKIVDSIRTLAQLRDLRAKTEVEVRQLNAERNRLYKADPESDQIPQLTQRLQELRKTIKLCKQIEEHSLQMAQRQEEEQKRRAEQERRNAYERNTMETAAPIRP